MYVAIHLYGLYSCAELCATYHTLVTIYRLTKIVVLETRLVSSLPHPPTERATSYLSSSGPGVLPAT